MRSSDAAWLAAAAIFALAALGGALLWWGAPRFGGHLEPWDAWRLSYWLGVVVFGLLVALTLRLVEATRRSSARISGSSPTAASDLQKSRPADLRAGAGVIVRLVVTAQGARSR